MHPTRFWETIFLAAVSIVIMQGVMMYQTSFQILEGIWRSFATHVNLEDAYTGMYLNFVLELIVRVGS